MSAAENGVVISTINAAVEARILSSLKEQRVSASSQLSGPSSESLSGSGIEKSQLIEKVKNALHASKIISYAQGFVSSPVTFGYISSASSSFILSLPSLSVWRQLLNLAWMLAFGVVFGSCSRKHGASRWVFSPRE